MKHFLLIATTLLLVACSGGKTDGNGDGSSEAKPQSVAGTPADKAKIYSDAEFDESKSFIVISKKDLRLYVYADINGDTTLIAHFPVCLSKNKGQKQRKGDMKTPECTAAKPFKITEIVDASKWTHDFGDGRGEILAYGDWFMRLYTPGHSGIGIHGSTNNESSVPGRGSEGCIRLRNDDLNELKEKYAFAGMKVVILADEVK